jgi:cardiolipin synthase
VLVDHISNMQFNKKLFKRLGEGGVEAHHVLPLSVFKGQWSRPDLRNHRKNAIIDGEIGFTGSQNLINNTYNKPATIKRGIYYEEVVAEVRGPVVMQMQAVFNTDWYSETGQILGPETNPEIASYTPKAAGTMLAQIVPSGPGHEAENNLALFIALLHHAQRKAVIITPYFVPDNALLAAIQIAALRGVNVTLIVSGIADQFLVSRAQRSYYQELLNAGVEIRLVEKPVILHAKNMSIDDDIAVIGSSNMDMRSFELTLEISLVLYDAGAVTKMREVEALYMGRSTPLKPEDWLERPFGQRTVENLTRLMSPLV